MKRKFPYLKKEQIFVVIIGFLFFLIIFLCDLFLWENKFKLINNILLVLDIFDGKQNAVNLVR